MKLFPPHSSLNIKLGLALLLTLASFSLMMCKADGPSGSANTPTDAAQLEAQEVSNLNAALNNDQYALSSDELNELHRDVQLSGASSEKVDKLQNR